jgi:hypothetical protein
MNAYRKPPVILNIVLETAILSNLEKINQKQRSNDENLPVAEKKSWTEIQMRLPEQYLE